MQTKYCLFCKKETTLVGDVKSGFCIKCGNISTIREKTMSILDELFPEREVGVSGKPIPKIMILTPEVAAKLHALNHSNYRNPIERYIQSLSEEMTNGNWLLKGTIDIDYNECLQDGQHRLRACIKSQKSIPICLMWGLDPEADNITDTNRRRTAANVAAKHGFSDSTMVGSLVRNVFLWKSGKDFREGVYNRDIDRMIPTLDRNTINKSVSLGRALQPITSQTMAAVTHFLLSEKSESQADLFFEGLRYGVSLEANSPILKLRNLLIQIKTNKSRMNRYVFQYMILAWNCFRTGNTLPKGWYKKEMPTKIF